MKERPILFNGPMVRAILDGSKTQTRRVCKPQPFDRSYSKHDHRMGYVSGRAANGDEIDGFYAYSTSSGGQWQLKCPYGQPGDRLWVRETWQFYDWSEDGHPCIRFAADEAQAWPLIPNGLVGQQVTDIWAELSVPGNYEVDGHARDRRWRPSIHMPRWASRILLEIVSVRVERLQDISMADVCAEGVEIEDRHMLSPCVGDFLSPSRRACRDLWNGINGGASWRANPWVWVIEFKRVVL
jgi:hypothetical protein